MWRTTDLTRLLGCDVPIVQAPLGGGPGTPELTAAVGRPASFGIVGGGYLDPDDLEPAVLARTRALTDAPSGSTSSWLPRRGDRVGRRTRAALCPVAAELGLAAELPEEPRGLPDPD